MIESISWAMLAPEIILLASACAIALIDLWVTSEKRGLTYALTLMVLLVVAAITGMQALTGATTYNFAKMLVHDPLAGWLKCFAALAVAVMLVYGREHARGRQMLRGGEIFTLSLFALLGMFVMISGHNFLVLYMGLELLTLSSYALVALRRDHGQSTEAAMKYFVLGALASGFLLYGLSMIYGATGSLQLLDVFQSVQSGAANSNIMLFGLVFVVAGLGFKLGVVPFHMWVPDVYQGAPSNITLMIGSAPKLAAFAFMLRILVEGLLPKAFDWQQMLLTLAVASLVVGNLAAIAQTNVKRMIAFSTISQMGFVLLAFGSGVLNGDAANAVESYSAAMFYVVTYVLTTLATFGVLLILSRSDFENEHLSDFAGLNRDAPWLAGIMTVCLFSLAGIPPLVGFYAKLAVLKALLASGSPLAFVLTVVAVLMSLIGAFYYLRLVKVMYFDAPTQNRPAINADWDVKALLWVNAAMLFLVGLMPDGLLSISAQAIGAALKS